MCNHCKALKPVVSLMERVNITRPPAAAASTLNYEPVVPFWISEETLKKKGACTVVEVEAHGFKVLLIINDKGEVKVSAWPTHMPFLRLVAMTLLD